MVRIYVGKPASYESYKKVAKDFYFMAKFQKVSSLIEKKRKISKEIKNLQENCNHSKKSIKSIKEHGAYSTFVIRWVCNDCERIIGIPNKQELNNYLK